MSNSYNNYGLFDRYLNKVKTSTVSKFGSLDRLQTFLHHLAEQGNLLLAVRATGNLRLSPLELAKLIKSDKYLAKCMELAQNYAAEVVEAVLYDRAINGYEELTFDKEGTCVARKKKYCSRSLLEYLKANLPKYQQGSKIAKELKNVRRLKAQSEKSEQDSNSIVSFEVESYEQETD